MVQVRALELIGQKLAETLGHRVLAAAQSQTVHLHTHKHIEIKLEETIFTQDKNKKSCGPSKDL